MGVDPQGLPAERLSVALGREAIIKLLHRLPEEASAFIGLSLHCSSLIGSLDWFLGTRVPTFMVKETSLERP